MTPVLQSFIEWIRTRPGGMAFKLNERCDNCQLDRPVVIYSEVQQRWFCGICHNWWVSYTEPIDR
jgi:ribosomal protein S27AE